jgi:hypothetical protein
MNKKIYVLMLVSMFLLITMQSISAVETKTGVTTSNDDEITPKPTTDGTATVWGYVKYWCGGQSGPVKGEGVVIEGRSGIFGFHFYYFNSDTTDKDGRYEINGIPAGVTWGGLFFRTDVIYHLTMNFYNYDTHNRYVASDYLTIPEPGVYRVDLYVEKYVPNTYETEPSNPIESSEQQQFESVFSGSLSL